MEREELWGANPLRPGEGYQTQWEMLKDLSAWVDLLLYEYYRRHQWLGPDSELRNMLGLVVSREEFEHNLTRASQTGLASVLSPEESEQIAFAKQVVLLRLKHTETEFPLLHLFSRCQLDEFMQECVILSYLGMVDKKYEKLFAYLQDDMTARNPSTALAVQLFLPAGKSVETYLARFSRHDDSGAELIFDKEALQRGNLVLRDAVVEFLFSGTISDQQGCRLYDGTVNRPQNPLIVQQDIAKQLDQIMEDSGSFRVLMNGPSGGGKRFQLEHLMSRRGYRCVFADLGNDEWERTAETGALFARLTDAYLCLYHLDRKNESGDLVPPDAGMLSVLQHLNSGKNKVFFLSELPIHALSGGLEVEIELPALTEQQRYELFDSALKSAGHAQDWTTEQLASTFRFGPRQIVCACEQAVGLARLNGDPAISGELIHRCCYRQAVHKLGDLASRIPAAHTWDDVVLPDVQKNLLKRACTHILHQHQVYYRWGFEKKISYGRGLSILFAGAPGTGKTMCAQVIAQQLNMELYKINISQIVSKYIGETEKNLRAVFKEAKHASCILFFDECDALFGKRSEVKDSHDRNANVEVAYLLQQIEEYDGVCVLATNLIGNIDAAFLRRITYVVHFPFPNPEMRENIYRRMLPDAAPVSDDIDWKFLGEKFELSGGHIKNIVLAAAFMAAEEGEPISMRQLLRAAVTEMRKNEIVVVREQLREYADLLED